MIRILLFALIFAMPAMADNFSNNQSGVSSCTVDIVGSSSAPITATANYSPITYNCSAGTYLPADAIECVACLAGNYCPGGTYTYNETTPQGINPCATNYTSSAGASTCVPMTYNINYVLNGGSSVPSTYTQLEYLESTGTQYIDTGLPVDDHNSFELTLATTSSSNGGYVISQYNNSLRASKSELIWFSKTSNYRIYLQTEKWYNVECGYNSFKVDDLSITVRADHDSAEGTSIYLFARNSGDNMAIVRMKTIKIYNPSSVLIFDGVPVRRNSDNVLGMYDTVSGTFFTNDGTGTFVAGPDAGSNWSQYTYGTGATMSATPTRGHSTFAGWCDDIALTLNCTTPKTIGTTATGDKTFYAKYLCDTGYSTNVSNTACDANTINIQWDDGNGGYTAGTCSYGGSITTPTTAPTKRGHVFTGWTFDLGN